MSGATYEERLKTGRNAPCPCGSGKKYKKCHLAEDEAERSAHLKALQEAAVARAAEKAEAEEDEADTKVAAKGKPRGSRNDNRSASKGQAADAKPKNIPRRGAV